MSDRPRVRVYCDDRSRNFHRKHGRTWLADFEAHPFPLEEGFYLAWRSRQRPVGRSYSLRHVKDTRQADAQAWDRYDGEALAPSEFHVGYWEEQGDQEMAEQERDRLAKWQTVKRERWDELVANTETPRGPKFRPSLAPNPVLSDGVDVPMHGAVTLQGDGLWPLFFVLDCPCQSQTVTIAYDLTSEALNRLEANGVDEISLQGLLYALDQLKD